MKRKIMMILSIMALIIFSGCELPEDISVKENRRDCKVERFNIKSLDVDKSISGSFFIGIGSFDNDIKYYFYQESDFGGYELKSIRAEHYAYKVVIKETNTTNPHINYYDSYYRCKDNPTTDGRYDLIVPIGTIQKTFSGDIN